MNGLTAETILDKLTEVNLKEIYLQVIENAEEKLEELDETSYALMFNVETDELFFLPYATSQNSWAKTASSQNPWIIVGHISAWAIENEVAKEFLIRNLESKLI
jgi:hypothetical protein